MTNKSKSNINTVLPHIYYGIFQVERKRVGTLMQSKPLIYICMRSVINNDCNIVAAHTEAFKTKKQAVSYIPKLPKPAMYIVLPLYISL